MRVSLLIASKRWLPYLSLGLGILGFSVSSFFIRWAESPGIVTSFYRQFVAMIILFPFAIQQIRRYGMPGKKMLIFPILAGVIIALEQAVLSTSLRITRVANATMLNYLAPLWVALFAGLLLKEKLGLRFWVGLFIAFIGMVYITGGVFISGEKFGTGDGLAFISSILYAFYVLVLQRGRTHIGALTYVWLIALVASITQGGLALGLGMSLTGYSLQTYLMFLAIGTISQAGGHFFVTYALGYIPASIASSMTILQPVATALLAIPLVGEGLSTGQISGGTMILFGVYLVVSQKNAGHSSA